MVTQYMFSSYSYFNQFDWSYGLTSLLAFSLPFFILFLVSNPYFMSPGLLEVGFIWGVMSVSKGMSNSPFGKKTGGVHLLVFLLFTLLLFNYLGLIPFVNAVSSNASVVFFFALFFWGLGTLGSLLSDDGFFKGLWVKGGSIGLNFTIILCEFLSWLARPLVLGLRLLVNVVCGHILLSLLGEMSAALVWSNDWALALFSVLGGLVIGVLELLVMFIQTVIFLGLVGWSWLSNPKAPRSFSMVVGGFITGIYSVIGSCKKFHFFLKKTWAMTFAQMHWWWVNTKVIVHNFFVKRKNNYMAVKNGSKKVYSKIAGGASSRPRRLSSWVRSLIGSMFVALWCFCEDMFDKMLIRFKPELKKMNEFFSSIVEFSNAFSEQTVITLDEHHEQMSTLSFIGYYMVLPLCVVGVFILVVTI